MSPVLYVEYNDSPSLDEKVHEDQWNEIREYVDSKHIDALYTDGFNESGLRTYLPQVVRGQFSYTGDYKWDTVISLLERGVQPVKTESDIYQKIFGEDPSLTILHPEKNLSSFLNGQQVKAAKQILQNDNYIDGYTFRIRNITSQIEKTWDGETNALALLPRSLPVYKELMKSGIGVDVYRPPSLKGTNTTSAGPHTTHTGNE